MARAETACTGTTRAGMAGTGMVLAMAQTGMVLAMAQTEMARATAQTVLRYHLAYA